MTRLRNRLQSVPGAPVFLAQLCLNSPNCSAIRPTFSPNCSSIRLTFHPTFHWFAELFIDSTNLSPNLSSIRPTFRPWIVYRDSTYSIFHFEQLISSRPQVNSQAHPRRSSTFSDSGTWDSPGREPTQISPRGQKIEIPGNTETLWFIWFTRFTWFTQNALSSPPAQI